MATIVFRDYDPSNPWTVTGEQKTIANGFIILDYAPLNGSLAITGYTATTNKSNIGTNEFYIDYNVVSNYKAADQRVYFNTAKNGTTVTCSYQGVAQTIFAVYLNAMMQHTVNTQMHAPAPAASGFLKTSTGADPVWANITWNDIQNKPNFADASWKAPVAAPANLPLTSNTIGDLRLVINDGDGDGAIYSCIATTGNLAAQWEKISDVGFATPSWSAITSKPTTVAGFGISDALTTATASATPTANKLLYLDSSAKFSGSVLTDGTVTDAKLGSRTVDQSLTTTTSTGTLTNLLSWIAGMVKAITGETYWYTVPQTTLSATKAHMDSTSPHGASASNTPSSIVMRNDINQIYASGILLYDTAAQIELGSTSSSCAPYIDFHSSGAANDYDSRIMASGGTSGTNGAGDLYIYSDSLNVASPSATNLHVKLSSGTGTSNYLSFLKAGSSRWTIGSNSSAESGSNVGSDFIIYRYSDAAAQIGAPFTITRSSGMVTVGDSADSTPIQLYIKESSHATSCRASLKLGSGWSFTQDTSASGIKDFGINSLVNSITPFKISSDATKISIYNSRASSMQLEIASAAGQYAYTSYSRGASYRRWHTGADNVVESGSNTGSNYYISRFDDSGTWLGISLNINRATGKLSIGDSDLQYPIQMVINETAHATSCRAALQLGSGWLLNQDLSGTGAKDLGFYSVANSTAPLQISADGTTITAQNTRATQDMIFSVDANVARVGALNFKKSASQRWSFACDNVAESGSNAGSNLYLTAATDAGAYLGTPMYVYRTGKIQFNSGSEDFTINSSKAVTDARLPRTLSIPGGTNYASNFMLCPDAMKLASCRILMKSTIGADVTPSASTSILIKKVVSGVTTTVATISGITVASTTYDVSPDASIEAGAYVYAQFSGSNNGVDFANVILVWA